jgi:hypothetical protein
MTRHARNNHIASGWTLKYTKVQLLYLAVILSLFCSLGGFYCAAQFVVAGELGLKGTNPPAPPPHPPPPHRLTRASGHLAMVGVGGGGIGNHVFRYFSPIGYYNWHIHVHINFMFIYKTKNEMKGSEC